MDAEIQELVMHSESVDSETECTWDTDERDDKSSSPERPLKKNKLDETCPNWTHGDLVPSVHSFDFSSFRVRNVGITVTSNGMEYFDFLFSRNIMDAVVEQTNLYYWQVLASCMPF